MSQPPVHVLDHDYLGVPGSIASFVVEGPDGLVLIETGPSSTLEKMLTGLDAIGFTPADISDVLVTHIHLDHAGAAGWWAAQGANVHVHEFGVTHLIDPSKLLASATRIYGNDMDRLWGSMEPAPADRIKPIKHRQKIRIAGLRFEAIETPGHARHHHAFELRTPSGTVCFAGDAAAMIVPRTGTITLPTPPPEFDLVAWLASIGRLRARPLRRLYLTHYGAIDNPAVHLDRVGDALRQHARFIHEDLAAGLERDDILRRYTEWTAAETPELTDAERRHFLSPNLLSMSVDGQIRYWNSFQHLKA